VEYQGWVNPYAADIGHQIAQSADAQARAAEIIGQAQASADEQSGAAWGGAVRNIGAIPQQLEQSRDAAVTRKLKEEELAQTVEQRAEQRRQRIVMTVGRLAGSSPTPEAFLAGVDQQFQLGALDRATADHIKAQVQSAGPDGSAHVLKQYVDFADQYQPLTKLGEGDTLVRPSVAPGAPATTVASGTPKPLVLRPGDVAVPQAGGQPIATAPFAPGTGQHVVNGQVLDATGAPVGAAVPPQEKPSEVAVNQARVTELQAQAKKIDAELSGTLPVSPVDRMRLDLERTKIANELEHYRMIEAHDDPSTPKNQERLEQQYRGVLTKVLSSRSGGLGLEDQKVNQAKHLLALFDQSRDPKTGEYSIPKVMQSEIALGLARLISPTGQVGEGMMNEFNQRSAKGDLAGFLTYMTGHPFTGSTQDIFKMYRDSIERQAKVAEGNRESYLDSIRAYAPTDLADDRRQKLEQGLGLNRLGPGGDARSRARDVLQNAGKATDDAAIDLFLKNNPTFK